MLLRGTLTLPDKCKQTRGRRVHWSSLVGLLLLVRIHTFVDF